MTSVNEVRRLFMTRHEMTTMSTDTVELSRRLTHVEKEVERMRSLMDQILASSLHRQQAMSSHPSGDLTRVQELVNTTANDLRLVKTATRNALTRTRAAKLHVDVLKADLKKTQLMFVVMLSLLSLYIWNLPTTTEKQKS